MSAPPALELSHVGRRFGSTVALCDASLAVPKGTLQALLGENGAGKSTLLHIAYGELQPHAGHLAVDGVERRFLSPADAIAAGIGMVHQHFRLVPAMTVTENVALGRPGRWLALAEVATEVERLGEETGLRVDPRARVGELGVAAQQRVEIVKALLRGARVLILDEPTAVLAPSEAAELLAWVRRHVDGGGSAVLITHKLREALSVADGVTVLRRGMTVLSAAAGEVDERALVEAMMGERGKLAVEVLSGVEGGEGPSAGDGRSVDVEAAGGGKLVAGEERAVGGESPAGRQLSAGDGRAVDAERSTGEERLAADQTSAAESLTRGGGWGAPPEKHDNPPPRANHHHSHASPAATTPTAPPVILHLEQVSYRTPDNVLRLAPTTLDVRAGEIVGVAGVEGAGHHELLRILAGRLPPTDGIAHLPAEVGFIPEDRHRDALALSRPLTENVTLRGAGRRRGRIDWRAETAHTARLLIDHDVRGGTPRTAARALSGGNQQKLVLGRELEGPPPALVVESPTRGLDVRASVAVLERLRAVRGNGMAVVVYSSDLDELLSIADRVLVALDGRIREVPPTHEAVARAMVGAR